MMHFPFPLIRHLDEVLPSIRDREEFVVKRDPASGIIVLNYLFQTPETFPDPKSFEDRVEQNMAAMRHECRGITFDAKSGDLLVRKYAKFMNVGQTDGYAANRIDWTRQHWILEKLDGSMLTPFVRRDGVREWHTKMGATPVATPVAQFVASSGLAYDRFCDMVREQGKTPIFEWCSRRQRIVIDYPDEMLVLTAIRDNLTGEYTVHPEMVALAGAYGIPAVKALDARVDDVQAFLRDAKNLRDSEGFVVRFDDGSMCKVKGEWYCAIHGTHDKCQFEKDVLALILNDQIDDAKPFMNPDLLTAVDNYTAEMFAGIAAAAQRFEQTVARGREMVGDDKKRFAMEVVNTPDVPSLERGLLFQVWDGRNAVEVVKNLLRKHTGTHTKVEEIRPLIGSARWERHYLNPVGVDD